MSGFGKIWLFIFWVVTANAQKPFFKIHELGEPFQKAIPEIIYEDNNSALWVGTTGGLFLYDGIEYRPYLKEDSTSNHVRSIFQDSKDRFWVGYEDGTIYHLVNHRLVLWSIEEGCPKVPVNGFAEDAEGNIWISTYGEGVYFYDEKRLYNFNTDDGLLGDDIYVMQAALPGHVWVGTDRGISKCSFSNNRKSIENYTSQEGLPDDIVKAILINREGQLWVGTYDGGVALFDPVKKTFSRPLPDRHLGIVNCLEIFEGTDLWIGTQDNGLWRYSLTQGELSPLPSLENAKVTDLLRDIEGNIWVVSSTHGICSANRQFEFIPTDIENVQSVLVDSKNRLWIGTPSGLFTHFTDRSGANSFQQYGTLANLNTTSLYEDVFGNIWIGTFGEGLYIFQPNSGAVRHIHTANGLEDGNVLSIDGVDDRVWIATLGGAMEITYDQQVIQNGELGFRSISRKDNLGTNFIYKVFIDSKGRVWFGTDGKGISVLENDVVKNYPVAKHEHQKDESDEDYQLHAVYSITEDKKGSIWLSTDNAGIFEFDGAQFNHLTVKEGIRDLEITSLATDANGQIIIVHPTGLDVLTPSSKHLIYYDNEVGVHDLDPNLNAVCTDRFGNVWIGGKNKIIKYTALKEDLEIHPRTFLNDVSVFLEPIDFEETNVFSHKQNNLVFEYLGIWYTDPQIVKYRYQLTGYDLDWIESKDRKATYSNLPSGKYTFKVTSTENDAWADEPVITYPFEVLPPIWMRWWLIAIVLGAVAGLFYLYQKNRDKRIQLVNLLEKDKVESQLAALKAQINPHFLFNSFNTLVSVIEESPQLAVEYVENLSDFYRKIMQLRDKEIISIQEEIELVKNYAFLLEKRYGKNFKLHINLKGQQTYIVPFTLQLLVENAVKHNIISKSKPLKVDIEKGEEGHITVKNNLQPKLTKEKSTNFGLQSLSQRYKLLGNRKVKVEESATFFKVSIPIIE
ncbi:MAG: two-component regulator propeller domain-containing protein [Bacteroidota bacterium]